MERAFGVEIPLALAEVCHSQRTALIVYDMQLGILSQISSDLLRNDSTATQLRTTDVPWTETPLWLYVLVEAEAQHKGEYLGEVGGRIVAEVILELLRHDPTSFLNDAEWRPELADSEGKFKMANLLKFAAVAE